VLTVGVLCLFPAVPVGRSEIAGVPSEPASAIAGPVPVDLTVIPSTGWVPAGGAIPVSAVWSGGTPGCSVAPTWFAWSITSEEAEGSVAPGTGARVNFTAAPNGSGVTNVTAFGAATLDCGNRSTGLFQNATARIRVDAPPVLQDLSVDPDPVAPGSPVQVEGTIAGGEPPYNVSVSWNRSRTSTAEIPQAGPFAVGGVLDPGTYDPTVVVTDGAGLAARGTSNGPVTVGNGFAIGLRPSADPVDAGTPVIFTIESDLPGPNYTSVVSCPGFTGADPRTEVAGARFSCTFPEPGAANVTAYATEAASPYALASTFLIEQVAAAPSLSVPAAVPNAEVGETVFVPVAISGGTPPFTVSWQFAGSAPGNTTTVPGDGTFLAAVVPDGAGVEPLTFWVTDADGSSTENSTAPVPVSAPLSLEVVVNGSVTNGTPGIGVLATVLGGDFPLDWVVVCPQAGALTVGGTLEAPGTFLWSGTGTVEGPLSAQVDVVDDAGAVRAVPCTATPTRPLTVETEEGSAVPGGWTAVVLVTGGIAPYQIWANGSSGSSVNLTSRVGGTVNLSGPAPGPGNLSVNITVVDAFGAVGRTDFGVVVPSAAPPRSSAGDVTGAGIVLLGSGVVGGLVFLGWRERRRREAGPLRTVDPVRTLKEILEPADGADRAAVELLAEEQGVPLETVRSTLDQLVRDGRVRSERGTDGEEILAWRGGP